MMRKAKSIKGPLERIKDPGLRADLDMLAREVLSREGEELREIVRAVRERKDRHLEAALSELFVKALGARRKDHRPRAAHALAALGRAALPALLWSLTRGKAAARPRAAAALGVVVERLDPEAAADLNIDLMIAYRGAGDGAVRDALAEVFVRIRRRLEGVPPPLGPRQVRRVLDGVGPHARRAGPSPSSHPEPTS
jgi:hypothetical protein